MVHAGPERGLLATLAVLPRLWLCLGDEARSAENMDRARKDWMTVLFESTCADMSIAISKLEPPRAAGAATRYQALHQLAQLFKLGADGSVATISLLASSSRRM